jgi:hypothetical protein
MSSAGSTVYSLRKEPLHGMVRKADRMGNRLRLTSTGMLRQIHRQYNTE